MGEPQMNPFNFSIIGLGRIGNRHASIIPEFGAVKNVVEINLARLNEFKSQIPVSKFQLIEDLPPANVENEIAVICTPNGLHSEHTILCLKKGYHVICEKPMALSSEDCKSMIEEAEKNNKHLFVVKQNRFNPPVQAVKSMIDKGKLGKILSVHLSCIWNRNDEYYKNDDWKGSKKLDGGILFTQFSHFIDLLSWFLGPLSTVSSHSHNFLHLKHCEFNDTIVSSFETRQGVLGSAHFSINAFEKNMEGGITILGEKGTVKIGGQYLNELEYQLIKGEQPMHIDKGAPPNDYGHYQGSMSNHKEVYKNVIEVIKGHAEIATNGTEGLKTVGMIEQFYGLDR